jgi:hypothetical protein
MSIYFYKSLSQSVLINFHKLLSRKKNFAKKKFIDFENDAKLNEFVFD